MGGYLTHAGQLHRGRLEMVLQQLANLELETLEQRAQVGRTQNVCQGLLIGCKLGVSVPVSAVERLPLKCKMKPVQFLSAL